MSVDITAPAFKADPFPFYARLRAEAPVFPVAVRGRGRAWLVTRYDDVQSLLRDGRLAKDPRSAMTPAQLRKAPWVPPMFKPLMQNLLGLDPPDHTRLRALVHKAFTPRIIERMRGQVETLADELLDAAAPRGRMDLIADYATPLPLTVIGRILGVPPQDNDRFHHWTSMFVTAGTNRNLFQLVPAFTAFLRYMRRLVKQRTADPRDDLISALAQAKEGGDELNEDEILAMIFILLSAGHETTLNLIGSGTLALLQHPDQLARLRDEPALGRPAVEELLRYVTPAETATERYPREDLTIAGTTVPRGEMVLGVIASANRDARVFEDPDVVDVGRQDNPHLSFGQGIHYCVGAPLARMEGQIGIAALLRRLPGLRLGVPADRLRWRGSFVVRGMEELPVAF